MTEVSGMMSVVTNSAGMHPDQIPGYDGGPLAHLPELLDEPLFWLGHLHSCVQSEEAEELLFGADYDAAEAFHRRLTGRADWPAFSIPVTAGRLYIVCRNLEGDAGTDYLLHHPDWDRAELLARDDGHFMGPGLAWPELAAAADNGLAGGSTTDPDSRLLLLLPAFGDTAVPTEAAERLVAALSARTAVEDPEQLAAALLEDQGPCGPAHWTTQGDGRRINDGRYSFRNPTNGFALSVDRLARVTTAMAP
ncbi:hypothetical protein LIX60_21370 [Streptomyces sp. S07_1.15]|uniref:hypothetical protein n=1 Tax=Streptomyces sp. S07_1.15 TaxID=2873925 RepID=UPI001D15BB8F|nr:hypothetical protein [Streptomyces sp. S07_1.15]MCC3653965.1 hypothetical protein [Streptomyces sp. S07_1.15]